MSKRLESMDQLAIDHALGQLRASVMRWRLACLALAIIAAAAVAWAALPRYSIAADGPWLYVLNATTGNVERVPAVEIPQRKP